jgi:hypothetical protein
VLRLHAGKSGDTLKWKFGFRQAMEFAINAGSRILQWIGIRLMTPGGRKAPGVFILLISDAGREGVIA